MFIVLLIWFVALQVADIYTTAVVIAQGGRETNKLVAWFIARLGLLPGLILIKVIVAAIVVFGFYWYRALPITLYALGLLVGFYIWVVWHNYRQFKS